MGNKARQPFDVSSPRDVFEGLSSDSMFVDIEPPRYVVTENARQRIPSLDLTGIPHCSNSEPKGVPISEFEIKVEDRLSDVLSPSHGSNLNSPQNSGQSDEADPDFEPPNFKNIPAPPPKNKGKGKGASQKGNQESSNREIRVSTRLREKQEREARINIESGMGTLVSSGRRLSDKSEPVDLENTSQPLVGDFSAHDLI